MVASAARRTNEGSAATGQAVRHTVVGVLATLGDLIEDIAVRVARPVNVASDTTSVISRRRGGSAANVAETAALLGHSARFIGQVGTDPIGAALIADLSSSGVDVRFVRRAGTTGTIIVLVDPTGERTMLTDRRTCLDLADAESAWLDGVSTLHVPLYSLIGGATASTASTVVAWANDRGVAVSLDLSSTTLMSEAGNDVVRELIDRARPDVIFANTDEAAAFGIDGAVGDAITVVKSGPDPAVLHLAAAAPIEIPATPAANVRDTTGAGDAFAAGFLASPGWRDDPASACRSGHRAAHLLLTQRSA